MNINPSLFDLDSIYPQKKVWDIATGPPPPQTIIKQARNFSESWPKTTTSTAGMFRINLEVWEVFFWIMTRVSMEVIVTIVGKVFYSLCRGLAAYIGVLIHVLSTMDIPV